MKMKKHKQGIALVIVLGLISLLLITMVSFITMMRTERISANNYLRTVQAEEAALAALDQIIYNINQGGSFPSRFISSDSSTSAVPCDIDLVYYDASQAGQYPGGHFFIDPTVTAQNLDQGNSLRWVTSLTNLTGDVDYGILYAYILQNDSWKLDINATGQVSRLNKDYFPREMFPASVRGKMTDTPRVYNNAEILWGIPEEALDYYTSYLVYAQKYDADPNPNILDIKDRAYIGGSETDLPNHQNDILDALSFSGITESNLVYNNLIDYVDADSTCQAGAAGYCSEILPMISEIKCTITAADAGAPTYSVTVSLEVEVWNPFTNTIADPTTLQWNDIMAAGGAHAPEAPATLTINNMDGTNIASAVQANTKPYTAFNYDTTNGDLIITVQPELVGIDTIPPLLFTATAADITGLSADLGYYTIADPRANHDVNAWGTVLTDGASTLGTENPHGAAPNEFPPYIANAPIENIGEIGFISATEDPTLPWTSIDLITSHKSTLDAFTAHSNEYVRGLVNMNTEYVELLEAAIDNTNDHAFVYNGTNAASIAFASTMVNTSDTTPFEKRSDATSIITDENIWAGCSDLMDVTGNAFTVIIGARTYKDNSSASNPAPNGRYDTHFDPTLNTRLLVAQIWRDPISKEAKVTFMKWQRNVEVDWP